MMTKQRLMKQIQVYAFATNEAALFLDTHPDDRVALRYFAKYRALLRDAVRMYEKHYGPITQDGVENETVWTWVTEPWPWEMDFLPCDGARGKRED